MISLHKTLLKPLVIELQFVQFAFPWEVPTADTGLHVVGHSGTSPGRPPSLGFPVSGHPGTMFLMGRCKAMPTLLAGRCRSSEPASRPPRMPLGLILPLTQYGEGLCPTGTGRLAIHISAYTKGQNWLETTERAAQLELPTRCIPATLRRSHGLAIEDYHWISWIHSLTHSKCGLSISH